MLRRDERALALRHLLAVDGEEAVDVDFRRQVVAGRLQHAGPEQRVEVRDVLADEVVNLAIGRSPPIVELLARAIAPLLRRGHVADRRVEPHVPIVAGAVGNLETEVRGRPRDVPIAERLAEEVALQVVGDLRLQVLARLRPLFQEAVQLLELDEQMRRLANFGRRAAERAARIDQLGRAVVVAAAAAVVARLVGRAALGTCAADEAVGQERAGLRIVELLDVALFHQPGLANRLPNLVAQRAVLGAVRAAVVVELDIERGEVALVGLLHLGDEFLFADAGLPGADHHRRAVRVVGTHVHAAVADQLLEPHPDVGLDVLDQMADVDVAIGVGQGRGDEDSTHRFQINVIFRRFQQSAARPNRPLAAAADTPAAASL